MFYYLKFRLGLVKIKNSQSLSTAIRCNAEMKISQIGFSLNTETIKWDWSIDLINEIAFFSYKCQRKFLKTSLILRQN